MGVNNALYFEKGENMESNKITIIEEDGSQKEMEILFTFDDAKP